MPGLAGVDHVTLTVTNLDVSTAFYQDVMGLLPVLEFGVGRVLMDRRTGLTIGLMQHEAAHGGRFTELATGLDHLGFEVGSREELVDWERHLKDHDVEYTPINDQPLAHHLNFRDPDGIALEITAPTEVYAEAMRVLMEEEMSDDEILDYAARLVGAEVVVGRH